MRPVLLLLLLSLAARDTARAIAKKMTYLELSTNPHFMDHYVSALFLPHTDRSAFPSVMRRVSPGNRGPAAPHAGDP